LLEDVIFLAADTSRSRVYAQALIASGLRPSLALLLPNGSGAALPGQSSTGVWGEQQQQPVWMSCSYDLTEPLEATLQRGGIPFTVLGSHDINDPVVVARLAQYPQSVCIYSGYGGVLVSPAALATGKQFLHIHGGYLPDFKGSTTNYYSLLAENTIGASAIFLTAEIDSGPVLMRRKFAAPFWRTGIDHLYDAAARAEVLIETLYAYQIAASWSVELPENSGGDVYYVIHPVLKHLAVLAQN
jgi:methionyl-tRNA formyltransferase